MQELQRRMEEACNIIRTTLEKFDRVRNAMHHRDEVCIAEGGPHIAQH